jgi:hypothetical protein
MRDIAVRWLWSVALLAVISACRPETGRLTTEQEQRLHAEGVRHRADNVRFRYTYGRRGGSGWEDRLASIVVTDRTVLIHKNEKVGLEITPTTRRIADVHRDGRRVRISVGRGQSGESWSFEPSDDAESWTQDIRSVIRRSNADNGR